MMENTYHSMKEWEKRDDNLLLISQVLFIECVFLLECVEEEDGLEFKNE